jgi:hypothetical protein
MHLMLMKVLQMLKFSLKKDWQSISFTDGWKTVKVEMTRAKTTKKDLLAQLSKVDHQATIDTLLKVFDDEYETDSD